MISKAYQSYSNRGRSRELANVVLYLLPDRTHQAPGEGQQPAASTMATQMTSAFSTDYPLLALWPEQASENGSSQGSGFTGGSVEATRTKAQQKVKALEVQIKKPSRLVQDLFISHHSWLPSPTSHPPSISSPRWKPVWPSCALASRTTISSAGLMRND